MFQTQIGIHLIEAPILILQIFEPLDTGRFHLTVRGSPVVLGRFGHTIITRLTIHAPAALNLFQGFNYLAFTVSSLFHLSFSA